GASDLAEGVVNGVGRERGVQPSKGVAQSPLEHHLAVVGAFGGQLAGGISGPCATCQPRPHSQSRAASSTTDSVKPVTPNASSSVSARELELQDACVTADVLVRGVDWRA